VIVWDGVRPHHVLIAERVAPRVRVLAVSGFRFWSGDTPGNKTPCRMAGVTLRGVVTQDLELDSGLRRDFLVGYRRLSVTSSVGT